MQRTSPAHGRTSADTVCLLSNQVWGRFMRSSAGVMGEGKTEHGGEGGELHRCLGFGLVTVVGQHPKETSDRGWTESPGWQEQEGPCELSLLIIYLTPSLDRRGCQGPQREQISPEAHTAEPGSDLVFSHPPETASAEGCTQGHPHGGR